MQNQKTITTLLVSIPVSDRISKSLHALSYGYLEPDDSILENLPSKAQTLYDVYKLSKLLVKSKNIRHKLLGRSYELLVMRMAGGENVVTAQTKKRQKE